MRRPPPIADFPHYPIVGGTILLAVGVTIASATDRFDIAPLLLTPQIQQGQWWRLLTCVLPHGDVLHLLFNLYWLWVLGTLVEEVLGHAATLGIMCLLAAVSSAAEFALMGGGIGLSGVGYGLVGMLWALRLRDPRFYDGVDRATVQLFVIWFFFCLAGTMMHLLNIANVAHGAGAIAGVLLGRAMADRQEGRRLMAGAALVLMLCVCVWGATTGRVYVNISPDRGRSEAELGYEASQAGDDRQALRWFLQATKMKPDQGLYWYNLGVTYEHLGRTEAAEAAFARSRQDSPKNAGGSPQMDPGAPGPGTSTDEHR
jgi:membrane associated rhomboid family serine protease